MRYSPKIYVPILASALFINICGGFQVFAQTSEIENPGDISPDSNRAAEKKDQKKETGSTVENRTDDESEIKIETTLVINEVLVLDKDKRVVEGLTKEDFVISEDGRPQEIEEFSFGGEGKFPRSIVLVIDHSVSQLPFLQTSIEAAKCLVERLDPDDRMAIVTDNIEWLQTFTNDKKLLVEKLETLKERALGGKLGKSRQYSALMAALGQLAANENRRLVFIFQTDGDELNLLKGELPEKYYLPEMLDFGFEDVVRAAEKNRAVIYTIVPDIKFVELAEEEKLTRAKTHFVNSERAFALVRNSKFVEERLKPTQIMLHRRADQLFRQQTALAKLAGSAGGRAFYLEQPAQADTIYAEILADMKQRYVLGYYPSNQTRDGKSRRIKTEVRGRPDYAVWSRQSYIFGSDR